MRFTILAAAAALFVSVLGQDQAKPGPLGEAYPLKCADWCGPVVTIGQNICNAHSFDCFCDKPHMKKLVPLCDACAYNARNTGNGVEFYPKIQSVVQACSFKTTSVTQGFAAPTAAPVMAAGGIAALLAAAAL